MSQPIVKQEKSERALLVGVEFSHALLDHLEYSLEELKQLTLAAGAIFVDAVSTTRHGPDSAYFIGKGKVEEIKELVEDEKIDIVIFDDALTPSQQRNLEDAIECKVIDREALILDVFARRAKTSEGKLQVELAQYMYYLPRLAGLWKHFSRLGGGIGTRGPGETQLEYDRRVVRERIKKIKEKLQKVSKTRELQRTKRHRSPMPSVAIVGYTNAGKSTLLNALTDADALVEDQYFATLEPIIRRCVLDTGQVILLSDTVGFIDKLPHHLIEAFKSTLEEVVEADYLIEVHDINIPHLGRHKEVVDQVLKQLGAEQKPRLLVLNKLDMAINPELVHTLEQRYDSIAISATEGTNLDLLKVKIRDMISPQFPKVLVRIPLCDGKMIALAQKSCYILSQRYDTDSVHIQMQVPNYLYKDFEHYLTKE